MSGGIFGVGMEGMGSLYGLSEDPMVPPSVTEGTTLPETAIVVSPGGDTFSTISFVLGYVGMAAGAYHGYKRSPKHKVWGAIGYSLLGGLWIIGIPVMLAQGFGKPKGR